jgi:hypothetical protein
MAGEIGFWLYYIRLRLSVLFGFYKTLNPLDVKWRREHWERIKAMNRRKRF